MADEITKAGIQFVADDTKKQLIGDAQYLMKSAIDFIQKLENIVYDYEHLNNIMRLGDSGESLSRIRQMMKNSHKGLKKAIDAQYTFEEKINNFLGRQIHFAWVDVETGEVFLAQEVSAKKIYTLAKPGKGFVGNIKIKKEEDKNKFKQKLSSLPSFIQNEYKDLVNKRILSHQGLIKTIFSRIKDNSDIKNHPWYDKHPKTVYWQHPPKGVENEGKWSWSISTQMGFISQGYIRFIFNSIENLEDISEFNIGHFMTTFVEKGDKIPGIVKGDIIVTNTNDKVQIAVKSNTFFSTASIGSYITTAYQIIEFYDKLDALNIETVESLLNNLSDYQPWILKASQEKAEKNLNKIFEQFNINNLLMS